MMSISSHQNWVYLTWKFDTRKQAEKKLQRFKWEHPDISIAEAKIEERTVWKNSIIDTGKRYYDLNVTIGIYQLVSLLE